MSSGYEFIYRYQLLTAADLWISDKDSATATYGDINTWDVSGITDFSQLFYLTHLSLKKVIIRVHHV